MRKAMQLIAVAALFAIAASMTSCADSARKTVEFDNGQRVYVETRLYELGDTVCIRNTYHSATNNEYNVVSSDRWGTYDPETTWFGDSSNLSFMTTSYRMGVIIDERY